MVPCCLVVLAPPPPPPGQYLAVLETPWVTLGSVGDPPRQASKGRLGRDPPNPYLALLGIGLGLLCARQVLEPQHCPQPFCFIKRVTVSLLLQACCERCGNLPTGILYYLEGVE